MPPRNLAAAEEAVLKAVDAAGADATTATVVRRASAEQPSSRVREAYWKLLTERRLHRSPSGHVERRTSQ